MSSEQEWNCFGWWAGCDYYRATLRPQDLAAALTPAHCRNWVLETGYEIGLAGEEPEASQFFGYEGFRLGPLFAGYGPLGAIWQVSGAAAETAWRAIPQEARATRVDVHLTAQLYQPYEDLALYQLHARLGRHHGRGRQAKGRCIVTAGEGQTLQIGKRGGDKYGRLYDKGAETGEHAPGVLWRWECEYLNTPAQFLGIHRDAYLGGHDTAARLVCAQWDKWGVWVPGDNTIGVPIPPARPRASFDAEKRLRWLGRQVARTVQRLEQNESTKGLARVALGIDTPEGWLDNALGNDSY